MHEKLQNELNKKMASMSSDDWFRLFHSLNECKNVNVLLTESTLERARKAMSLIYGREIFYSDFVKESLTDTYFFGDHTDLFFAVATNQFGMIRNKIEQIRIEKVRESITGNEDLKLII